jgi:hypothetical protein
MNKVAIFILLVSNACVVNAGHPDEALQHPKKVNSEKPLRRFSAAVPPCPEEITEYLAAVNARNQKEYSKRFSSELPKQRELP